MMGDASFITIYLNSFFVDPTIRKYGEQEKDPGTKSEGEEDSQQGTIKKILGRTPNHLTLR